MSRRTKWIIALVALAQLFVIIVLLGVPAVVQALPGRYRARLPEQLVELVTTPLPTALPAPIDTVSDAPQVVIPGLEPTRQPTATVAPTTEPQPTSRLEDTTTPTPMPTDTATPTATPTATATPLPQRVLLEGLTGIPQGFNNCGPANLTQVLTFYGDSRSQTENAAYLKPNPEDRNVSPWQISDYVNEQSSLKATVHSGGTMAMLKRFVAAGLPVVVEKGYEPPTAQGWYGHYLTVYGYDDAAQEMYSMDTYEQPWVDGTRTDAYDEIEGYWQEFNYTFYVVYRPEQEAIVHEILGPDMLDDFTMWQNAALRAQEEIEAEPENPFVWYNLGTSLTELGWMTGEAEYYQNAAAAFDEARTIGVPPRMLWYQFRPYVAYWKTGRYDDMIALADTILSDDGGQNVEETYYYKGLALLSKNDVSGAVANFEAALARNENFYPAQLVLDSLGG